MLMSIFSREEDIKRLTTPPRNLLISWGRWILNNTSINPLTCLDIHWRLSCVETDNHVQDVQFGDVITDHHLLLCNVHHPKPHLQKTKIKTRAFRSINLPSFRTDILQGLGDLDDNLSVTDLLYIYDTQLTNVLNKHAPSYIEHLSTLTINICSHRPHSTCPLMIIASKTWMD